MKRNYYIVWLIMLTFFVISFLTNIIGALNPDFIHDFKLSLTLASLLPFSFFIAYGLVSIPTGILLERYKEKKIMTAGFVLAFLGSLLLAAYPNYVTAVVSLFLTGSGMAMLQVVINPLLRAAGGERRYAFNSVLAQLIFGIASFFSPRVLSFFTADAAGGSGQTTAGWRAFFPKDLPWLALYWIFAGITIVMVLIILLSKFPKVTLQEDEKAGALTVHLQLLKRPVVLLFSIGIFCYVGTEQGLNNTISLFLQSRRGYTATAAADVLGNFWGCMTIGNIAGLLLLKWMDSRNVLVLFTVLAMVTLSAAVFGPQGYAGLSFSLVGFFLSVMYPIIFSLALNSVAEHHGSFAGILVTAIIGGAVLPLVMAAVSARFGLTAGLVPVFLTMGYILSIGFWAKPLINNN